MAKLEMYTDDAGEWRWRLRAANGEIVIPPEGYKNFGDCDDIMRRVVSGEFAGADVEVIDPPAVEIGRVEDEPSP